MAQNNYGGPEHGVLQCLPPKHAGTSHGFDHKQFGVGEEDAHQHGLKSSPIIESESPSMFSHNSKSWRPDKRRKGRKWAVGGPGMQAIFLGSSPKCSGTGVFLPRCHGPDPISPKIKPGMTSAPVLTNFVVASPKIKPAMSPVLLPSHLIEALNLNVHELGQLIFKPLSPDETNDEDKSEKIPEDDNSSLYPEINLPEEWTY